MRDVDIPQIRGLDIFRDVSQEAFDTLIRATYLQTFPPRVQLFESGDRADFLPILLEGCVELYGTWSERQTTIMLVESVRTIIPAASILDAPYLMSARTMTKSRIALVPSENVRREVGADPAFTTSLVSELALGYRNAIRQIKGLKLRSGTERLANLLLQQSEAAGGARQFELPMEKRMIASLLGMSAENLSRAFAALRSHGVEVEGASVRLISPLQLRRFARACPLIDGDP
jgi:CRP/FNR family transcriptional regulator, transcriptional activator FtrB